MTANQTVSDTISVPLDYNLAVMLATHVDQSEKYDSRGSFVQEALWDKLCDEYESSDIHEAFIAWQEQRVATVKREAQQTIRQYEQEAIRLHEAQGDFEATVETEVEEFLRQLEDADYEST